MDRKIVVILILIIFAFIGQADKPLNQLKKVDYFDVDILGHIYTLSNGVLSKWDNDLKSQASFSDFSLGNITSFEAEDALNILVYYSDVEMVMFLDNNLNIKRSAIDLTLLGYEEAELACASYNTGFWIFDPVRAEVVRINRLMEKSSSSGNLQQILGEIIQPQKMRETNNSLILSDTASGVFLFDRYGAFVRKIPILSVVDFQLIDKKLKLLKKDTLFTYDFNTLNIDTLALPNKEIRGFKIMSDAYYLLNQSGELNIIK